MYQIKILELRNTIIAINVIDEFNIGLDTAKKKKRGRFSELEDRTIENI